MHYVIEQLSQWDVEASSMEQAIKKFKADPDAYRRTLDVYGIVCQEDGEESNFA